MVKNNSPPSPASRGLSQEAKVPSDFFFCFSCIREAQGKHTCIWDQLSDRHGKSEHSQYKAWAAGGKKRGRLGLSGRGEGMAVQGEGMGTNQMEIGRGKEGVRSTQRASRSG